MSDYEITATRRVKPTRNELGTLHPARQEASYIVLLYSVPRGGGHYQVPKATHGLLKLKKLKWKWNEI